MVYKTTNTSKAQGGFTLVEVMITLCLTAVMCVAVFSSLASISKLTMAVAIRSEAERLVQVEAERLTATDFSTFIPSAADQTSTGCLKTSFLSSSVTQFTYPPSSVDGRVIFTRRVASVAATSTTTTLRVEVAWTWQGRPNLVSTLLLRSR